MKTPEQIKIELNGILLELTGIERPDATPETKLVDLGIDSLDAVELLIEIEDRYQIMMPDDPDSVLVTVNDVVQAVAKELQSKEQDEREARNG